MQQLTVNNLSVWIDSGMLGVELDQGHAATYAYLTEEEAKRLRDWLMANCYLLEKKNDPIVE